jgi:hypothetical protein
MKIKILLLLVFFLKIANGALAQDGIPFGDEIKAFKHQDSLNFPPKDGILFIGSSSIRVWDDLEQRFPGKPIIRRGVGGSELWQLTAYYTHYILFPYHPKKVFIYDGENDIAGGRSAESVSGEFRKLCRMINKKLPEAQIYFMSIKRSPSRIQYWPVVDSANRMIKEYLENKPNSTFVDVGASILKDGTFLPDSSLFRPDMLHLKSTGYDKWQKVLEPYVN